MNRPPDEMAAGPFLLRRLRGDDVGPLAEAVNASLEHLRPWMPWAQEPATATSIGSFVAEAMASFESGREFHYLVTDPVASPEAISGAPGGVRVLGCCGLHPRLGPGALEIGYWVHAHHTRKGIATHAARALTLAAFALPEIRRVEIHCDETNRASAAIAARLGFHFDRTDARAPTAPGQSDREMIWSIEDPGLLRDPPMAPSGVRVGHLIGVGVGPGSPGLVTLEAVGVLRNADRIVAPTTGPDSVGRAESVVRSVVEDAEVHRVPFSMATEGAAGGASERAESHRSAAAFLVGWLDAGETVAFVTLGDPNIYSTFPSLSAAVEALRPDTKVSTVAGICAFQMLAAASGTVLLDGTESLELVTALDGVDHLRSALDDPTRAVVVYKGGRHLPAMAALLAERGRLEGAVVGELLGLPGERISPVRDAMSYTASYLATVIVPPVGRREEHR